MLLSALLASSLVQYSFISKPVPESVGRACAAQVGIPYASDNFSDAEWEAFKRCVIKRTK